MKFTFAPRSANMCADNLARTSLDLDDFEMVELDSPSVELEPLLHDMRLGFVIPQLMCGLLVVFFSFLGRFL